MANVRVRMDLRKFGRFYRAFKAGMEGAPGPVDAFFKQAAMRFLTFTRRRFSIYSRGGGDWELLSVFTIRHRRKGRRRSTRVESLAAVRRNGRIERLVRAGGSFAILRDTGTLFNALFAGSPGNYIKRIGGGIRVGIGGGPRHKKAPMTIGRLAEIHNEGEGRVPQRLIVTPDMDSRTRRGIMLDMRRAITKMGGQIQ